MDTLREFTNCFMNLKENGIFWDSEGYSEKFDSGIFLKPLK